jgi:hypothetical protein
MDNSTDRARTLKLLNGLEMGGLDAFEGRLIAEELDPVLVHVIVRYLREAYPATDPVARPVHERVVALTKVYPGLVARAREGEDDPVTGWFTSERSFREFRGRSDVMIDLLIDKLES